MSNPSIENMPATKNMSTKSKPQGAWTIYLGYVGVGLFALTSISAAIWQGIFSTLNVGYALTLFVLGNAGLMWAFFIAAQRSRREKLSISGVYFLMESAPANISRVFRLLLTLITILALATAGIRLYTSLAFGILTPIFILGLMGIWGAKWGSYPLLDSNKR